MAGRQKSPNQLAVEGVLRRNPELGKRMAKNLAQGKPFMWNIGRPKKLENMTATELQAQINKIAKVKEAKRKEEAQSLRNAITAMAREHGFKVGDLIR